MNKLLSCRYNMDTNRVEARFEGGTTLAIDCIAIKDEYGNTPAQRAELDWLLYHKPLEYAQLVLGGEIEHYLSLGCDHGRMERPKGIRSISGRFFRMNLPGIFVCHKGSLAFYCKIGYNIKKTFARRVLWNISASRRKTAV